MSEVSLQAYGAEMRQLVAEGAYAEALAIGRHILEIYPKHWQTYRLMGEACLEKGDYEEAHQLFARALACDPEDLFSRVGISVAHRRRGDLSLAIWHMERAYELSPGNAELRRELQELYAERDGTSRPRLKFTSGAVARLYARSHLWHQAIHEFRTLLRQNPDLVDVKVALAQALWSAGSKTEAAQLCQEVLGTYPHCLKANLILGEIWLHGEREMEGRALLQLAQDIDPENAVAQKMFGERSPLPARVVKIPRLEDVPIPEVPEEMEGEPEEEEALLPWLSEEEEVAPEVEPPVEAEIGELEEAVEEPVMAEADELLELEEPVAEEEMPEAPEVEEMLLEEERLAEGEEEEGIPDWLQRIRERHRQEEFAEPEAQEVLQEEERVEEGEEEEGIPDWLKELEMEAEAQAEAGEAEEEEEPEPLPDWLLEEGGVPHEEAVAEDALEVEPLAEGVDAELEALLAREMEAPAEEEEAPAEVEMAVEEEAPVAEAEVEAPPEAEAVVEEEAPAEAPDWMKRLGEEVRLQAEAAEAEEEEAPAEVEMAVEEEAPVAEAEVEAPPEAEVVVEEEAPAEAPVVEEEVPVAEAEVEAPPEAEVVVEEEAPAEAPEEVLELDMAAIAGEEMLARARELRDSGEADAALDLYEKMIHQEQLLSSVLADLDEGVSGPLAQPRAFTLIGDLCTKQGRLQRALEAYHQALDMLKK